jgi:low affinity Fe/Cu permease
MGAVLLIVVWAATGPSFDYSNTWQLVINTGTTIVTFLMVFLIQNTQNRDARAIHLKLDELLRSTKGARVSMSNLEHLPDEELKRLSEEFRQLCERRGIGADAVEAIEDEMEERDIEAVRA